MTITVRSSPSRGAALSGPAVFACDEENYYDISTFAARDARLHRHLDRTIGLDRRLGLLAGSVGQLIGVGKGRGIGLLFVIMGAVVMLTTVAGYLSPRLRRVEAELSDPLVAEAA